MIVVFVGPTLDVPAARAHLRAEYRPPAARGDVIRAVDAGADAIGLIDGYFGWTLSVWHKEILWALTQGTHVFGAASMGALRAVELADYGMRGVGKIFASYRGGAIEDDDEVAVMHDAGGAFACRSEAMVNIRATLAAACEQGVITRETRACLETIAKGLFYPDREHGRILELARSAGAAATEIDLLEAWLPSGRVDQKRADALAMLDEISAWAGTNPSPFAPAFALARTRRLDELLSEVLPASAGP